MARNQNQSRDKAKFSRETCTVVRNENEIWSFLIQYLTKPAEPTMTIISTTDKWKLEVVVSQKKTLGTKIIGDFRKSNQMYPG